jgi:hypothetical protein
MVRRRVPQRNALVCTLQLPAEAAQLRFHNVRERTKDSGCFHVYEEVGGRHRESCGTPEAMGSQILVDMKPELAHGTTVLVWIGETIDGVPVSVGESWLRVCADTSYSDASSPHTHCHHPRRTHRHIHHDRHATTTQATVTVTVAAIPSSATHARVCRHGSAVLVCVHCHCQVLHTSASCCE